jgi:hypothetical protein
MKHTIVKTVTAPTTNEFEFDDLVTNSVTTVLGRITEMAGTPSANEFLFIELSFVTAQGEGDYLLACKPRAYTPPEGAGGEQIGWGVAVLPVSLSGYVDEMPGDEIDNAVTNWLGLEGDDARFWTKQY